MDTRTVEVSIPGGTVRVQGLQRDRRRRTDLAIALPDGRVALANGRRPDEDGWEIYWSDHFGTVCGGPLAAGLAWLMGYQYWGEPQPPEWFHRLEEALA